jgi:CheY-like chemotaxis protein
MGLLKRHRPHVLLADVEMPGEDGYSLIGRVRALSREEGGDIPAAALTASVSAQDRMNALQAGYQYHVAKPVAPTELAAVVAALRRLRVN